MLKKNPIYLSGSLHCGIVLDMKKIIVLMGGQGVGKGTFARMLCETHPFKHIETGALLRESAKTNTKIADIMARGELVPEEDLLSLVSENINTDQDIILDGFPRTTEQAKWLVNNYADKADIHVIYLDVPEETMIQRIQKRIREGGGRADDANIDTIKRRLNIFWTVTIPAINWLKNVPNIKFSDVDVQGDVNDNITMIIKALEDK